jgi:hypothetical protein
VEQHRRADSADPEIYPGLTGLIRTPVTFLYGTEFFPGRFDDTGRDRF